jgi:hypothetical protein
VQVGAPWAALHAIIAAEVLTPATRSAYAGRWVGKQYGARGNSATWMHEAPGATSTKGRTDSEKDRATLWGRGVEDRFR